METVHDDDLGLILIKRNVRAKHITARRKGGGFVFSVPNYISNEEIKRAISQLKPRLLNLPKTKKYKFIIGRQLSTLTFEVNISRSNLENIYSQLKDKTLNISIPQNVDIENDNAQDRIKSIIEKYLRSEAKLYLPTLVRDLSLTHNFKYTSVSIQKSQTRWGSCSSTKKINLSYWCMLLPQHLVEFVILHELCHTIEMNHGTKFWALLDRVSDNQAEYLTTELKRYKTEL